MTHLAPDKRGRFTRGRDSRVPHGNAGVVWDKIDDNCTCPARHSTARHLPPPDLHSALLCCRQDANVKCKMTRMAPILGNGTIREGGGENCMTLAPSEGLSISHVRWIFGIWTPSLSILPVADLGWRSGRGGVVLISYYRRVTYLPGCAPATHWVFRRGAVNPSPPALYLRLNFAVLRKTFPVFLRQSTLKVA